MSSKILLDWYDQHARHLPWRQTTEPYPIWISEIMLQQTQVKTVLPRYTEWFEVFPDISSLALASLDNVLKQWEGLGYYRRARFIHATAIQIMDEHHGVFPSDFSHILALKGIGRSTAGAISSFCFKTPTPVLDGNVKRVLCSWDKQLYTDKELWLIAQTWIDQCPTPDLWNQAMMELGASLCQARKRSCRLCPMQHSCKSAFSEPVKRTSHIKIQDFHWQVDIHQCAEKGIWLEQRPESGIWAGLWSPPITVLASQPEQQPHLIHKLTHRRLHLYLNRVTTQPLGHGSWVKSWEGLAIPTGILRLFEQHYSNAY